MDINWIAIGLSDVVWISLAFILGFLARTIGLPPLVGFLATGFLLSSQGVVSNELIEKLADLGITLLLFTIGLKLSIRTLAKPQVWAVTMIHTSTIVILFSGFIYLLSFAGITLVSDLDLSSALLLGFALSFSSTVFVVKVLEEKGEMNSLYGRIAIGILIMQDVAAVLFLAFSTGKIPSSWALLLFLLIPLRPLLHKLLERVGHGELLVLYGFLLAMGGSELFELVGVKGDLGAIILGVLIASHPKAEEMAKTMLNFKNLFLVAFFLSIGLSGPVTLDTLIVGALLTPLIFFKSALFFILLTKFKLRARTSLLSTLTLSNYSEFGLIVLAIGVKNSWIESKWLITIAIAMALSFMLAAVLNVMADGLYTRFRDGLLRLQKNERLSDDQLLDVKGASVAIFGMGRIGSGAYDKMHSQYGGSVIGVDIDPVTVKIQREVGRNVLLGDPGDADFWDRVQETHTLSLIMLALPKLDTTLEVLKHLRAVSFDGHVAVTARYPDEVDKLKEAGAETVFNLYAEAGIGFATHVENDINPE